MSKIVKIGQKFVECLTPSEADRLPNIGLGKHCRINTNNILKKDERLNKYINDNTMSALDNYAKHENLNIYITPLENDIFHDVGVSVYKEHDTVAKFPIKINEGKNGLHDFLKELYEKVAPKKTPEKLKGTDKPNKSDDIKMFVSEKVDNIKNFRINQIRKFIEKHQNSEDGDPLKSLANVFENVYYNKLYK